MSIKLVLERPDLGMLFIIIFLPLYDTQHLYINYLKDKISIDVSILVRRYM
jgi:hypothetical protein